MTCCVSFKRRQIAPLGPRGAAVNERAARAARPIAFEIAGTWDFKWPLGTEIRIAFQTPPAGSMGDGEFAVAKDRVREYAARWEQVLPRDARGEPTIRLRFLEQDLDPPLGARAATPVDRHRSSFEPETPRALTYDVLISLEPLPIDTEDPFRGRGRELVKVIAPISELGSYARRADYGTPTIYLGAFGKFAGSGLVKYLESPLGQHVVVHEFGHVLGLPHYHQHPELIPVAPSQNDAKVRLDELDAARGAFYADVASLRAKIKDILGVDIDEEAIGAQVIRAWRGNMAFSDWTEVTAQERADHGAHATLDSVMTFPYYACLRRGHDACELCTKGEFSGVFTAPRRRDVEMLQIMYGAPVACRAAAPGQAAE